MTRKRRGAARSIGGGVVGQTKTKGARAKRAEPALVGFSLRLPTPAPMPKQIVRAAVAVASAIATLGLVIGCIVVESFYLFRALGDGSLENLPIAWHLWWIVADLVFAGIFLKSPFFEQPKLRGIPVELIDFTYVMRRQGRQLYFLSGLISFNMLPILYLNGVLESLASVALKFGSGLTASRWLGWVGTAALAGVIGNFVTYAVVGGARLVARLAARARPK